MHNSHKKQDVIIPRSKPTIHTNKLETNPLYCLLLPRGEKDASPRPASHCTIYGTSVQTVFNVQQQLLIAATNHSMNKAILTTARTKKARNSNGCEVQYLRRDKTSDCRDIFQPLRLTLSASE